MRLYCWTPGSFISKSKDFLNRTFAWMPLMMSVFNTSSKNFYLCEILHLQALFDRSIEVHSANSTVQVHFAIQTAHDLDAKLGVRYKGDEDFKISTNHSLFWVEQGLNQSMCRLSSPLKARCAHTECTAIQMTAAKTNTPICTQMSARTFARHCQATLGIKMTTAQVGKQR